MIDYVIFTDGNYFIAIFPGLRKFYSKGLATVHDG
jgi:hypothetical protein